MSSAIRVHTDLPKDEPKHHGEFFVAQKLVNMPELEADIWFNIDYLPNVTEIDLAIFSPIRGLYLIEIKSVQIDDIQTYDLKNFKLNGQAEGRQHPAQQILHASLKLREHLQRVSKSERKFEPIPFVQTTVLWPYITRAQWNKRFSDANINIQAKSMLFADELKNNQSLMDGLARLWEKPLHGVVPPLNARGMHKGVDLFIRVASDSSEKIDISSVSTELLRPVKQSKDLATSYPPPKPHKLILEGPPGTGKTTVLREIALLHANSGAAVLHICFNKVLAADQRREYQMLKKNDYGYIDVYDVWEFFNSFGTSIALKDQGKIANKIKSALSSRLKNDSIHYDTIVIDESQDMTIDVFETIELVARPTAAWFLSYGQGQEIYNFGPDTKNPSDWVANFQEIAERKTLRRSFRNTTRAFLIGQNYWENFPNLEKGQKWLADKLKQSDNKGEPLELDLQLPSSKNDFRIAYLAKGKEDLVVSLKSLLIELIEDSKNADRGKDLLIVVASPVKQEDGEIRSSYDSVDLVCKDLSTEFSLNYLDLVKRENRRLVPKNQSIRLVTHQGVRGLSASHVLVLDFDLLDNWIDSGKVESKPPLRNLGYILLSRSKASTVIGIRGQIASDSEGFIAASLMQARTFEFKK